MFYVLATLIGLALGQHIKISISPELQAFIKASWTWGGEEGLPKAQSVIDQIKDSSKVVKRLYAPNKVSWADVVMPEPVGEIQVRQSDLEDLT